MRRGGDSEITRRRAAALLTGGAALAPLGAYAQTPPSPSQTPRPEGQDGASVVKTSEVADRMTVPVMINGAGPYAFIVDTASDHSVVSDRLAARLALPATGRLVVSSATERAEAESVLVSSLEVGARRIVDFKAPVFTYDNVGADGLLGIDALADQNVVMDFRAKRMTIQESSIKDEPGDIVVSAKSRYGQLVLVDSSIEDTDLYVIIDTGGEASIANAALRQVVDRNAARFGASQSMSGFGGIADAPLAPIPIGIGDVISVSGGVASAQFAALPRVRLGGIVVNNLMVGYADVYAFTRFGLKNKPAMLLGMDILRRFDRVAVDFKARQVRFLLPKGA